MVSDLTDQGEEMMQKAAWRQDLITLPETADVLLYDDSSENSGSGIGDSDDMDAITTEPNDGNYSRKTVALLSGTATANDGDFLVEFSGGNWYFRIPALEWDVSDTTGNVDAYAIVTSVELDGDSGATEHLLFTQMLDMPYDLSGDTTLDTPAGGGMSIN